MNSLNLVNPAPLVHSVKGKNVRKLSLDVEDEHEETTVDKFDSQEVFDMVRHIVDPEHPLTLEELNVIQPENIIVDDQKNTVVLNFTPTIPHCSMATLIGLFIRVKLLRTLPKRFKVRNVLHFLFRFIFPQPCESPFSPLSDVLNGARAPAPDRLPLFLSPSSSFASSSSAPFRSFPLLSSPLFLSLLLLLLSLSAVPLSSFLVSHPLRFWSPV